MDWSSQQYIEDGLALGLPLDLLQRAVEQVEEVTVPEPELPAVLTLGHLADRTATDFGVLRQIVSRDKKDAYHHFKIRKRSGGVRVISVPEPALMRIQRWISKYVLEHLKPSPYSFAFCPGSSILKCAKRHVGAKWLIKMDVRSFFGSISEIQVYRIFRRLNYQPLVAFELARICTHAPSISARYTSPVWLSKPGKKAISHYNSKYIGYLPQGAPTSPMLSNLAMVEVDEQIAAVAKAAGLRYTRYSDDITLSTTGSYSKQNAKRTVRQITKILLKHGLHVNAGKTVISPPGGRKVVLGLLVDGATPRLSREFKGKLRQHLYYLEEFGALNHAHRRGFDSIWGMYRHVRGLLDFAKMVEKAYAVPLLSRLEAVDWPGKI